MTISTHFKGKGISEVFLEFNLGKFGVQNTDQLLGSLLNGTPPDQFVQSQLSLLLQDLLKLFATACRAEFIGQIKGVQLV